MVDITEYLQTDARPQKIVTQYCECIRAFRIKLGLWET